MGFSRQWGDIHYLFPLILLHHGCYELKSIVLANSSLWEGLDARNLTLQSVHGAALMSVSERPCGLYSVKILITLMF